MAEEVRLDAVVRDLNASRNLKNIGDAADKAGNQFEGMAKDGKQLDKQIGETEKHLKDLIAEFDRTGDRTLFKKISADRRTLSFLTLLKKQAGDTAKTVETDIADAGSKGGQSFVKSVSGAIDAAGPVFTASLVGLAVAAAPLVGATAAAALIGSAGVGGLIGGIVLASKDQRIKDLGGELGKSLLSDFKVSAEPIIGPLVDSMHEIADAGKVVSQQFGEGLKELAPALLPLTKGLTGLVEQAMPGVVDAMRSARPVLKELAADLPQIGAAIGDFFHTVSQDPDGAILALRTLSMAIEATLHSTGVIISDLSKVYEWSLRAAGAADHALEKVFGWVPGLGKALHWATGNVDSMLGSIDKAKDTSGDLTTSIHKIGSAAEFSASEIDSLKSSIDKLLNIQLNLSDATINYEQTFADMVKELHNGTRTLSVHTQAGRDNLVAINRQVKAVIALHDANIDNGMSIDEANRKYHDQIEAIRKTLIKLGFNKKAVDDLIAAYANVPSSVTTQVRADTFEATNDIHSLIQLVLSLPKKKKISVDVFWNKQGLHVPGGTIPERAAGGPMKQGVLYKVGEKGPEFFVPNTDGTMLDASTTSAMDRAVAGGSSTVAMAVSAGGGSDQPIVIHIHGDLKGAIRKIVRTDGRGSVNLAFERG